ncbi:MAG: prolyl-tRNA synthetase associated domain-containing protein [Candidatus Aenigmarchaeota archaeon]|nr:prolyl-tRNA synthetase associated domain-containing protein [Candidatus Aenigmarchaeota archaeon]
MKKLEGVVPINLLLKDNNDDLYLMIRQMSTQIKFKTLSKKIGTKGLQLTKRSALSEILSVPEGCATVFALLNDPENKIVVLVDDTIPKDGKVNFHPLRNDATMTISYEDMVKFVEDCGNEIRYF